MLPLITQGSYSRPDLAYAQPGIVERTGGSYDLGNKYSSSSTISAGWMQEASWVTQCKDEN
jgi:hypothetical protein